MTTTSMVRMMMVSSRDVSSFAHKFFPSIRHFVMRIYKFFIPAHFNFESIVRFSKLQAKFFVTYDDPSKFLVFFPSQSTTFTTLHSIHL